MKAIYVAVAVVAVVALSGCCDWRGRSCPVKPCLKNGCAVAKPAPCKQLEK